MFSIILRCNSNLFLIRQHEQQCSKPTNDMMIKTSLVWIITGACFSVTLHKCGSFFLRMRRSLSRTFIVSRNITLASSDLLSWLSPCLCRRYNSVHDCLFSDITSVIAVWDDRSCVIYRFSWRARCCLDSDKNWCYSQVGRITKYRWGFPLERLRVKFMHLLIKLHNLYYCSTFRDICI